MAETTNAASGVQELISRLRDEGVKAGREKSDQIVQEAQEQASHIVAQAKAEAEELLIKARSEIERDKAAAIESLRVAFRDTSNSTCTAVAVRSSGKRFEVLRTSE